MHEYVLPRASGARWPRRGRRPTAAESLPRASDLWAQASLDYKQRLQQLFFPEGIAYDGIRFNRTAVTAPPFNYLTPDQSAEEILVSLNFASWNHLDACLRQLDRLRQAA